ncbi:type IV pili twitching motility protein PilT [Candidatus Roizmanbacteria bacterium RIFCSPHIGHO2_12_FULL_44_10]|uniref:Type IV pili twitching motility protein PilT n=1 Tax=Candidatus Roizmanbacteria bacterium RIFCSPHIGHO2_12_FULL_44_10 TaxID=1802054 RepID=A0A1F7I7G2_9BACT|nr:MAG: type IV pili twitching motility protein PilT [Candidatus Roizmanbacteria bacterium RIFCSPHIGHO2_12_FULL_44_10]
MDITELLNLAVEKVASDLHIIPGYHPSLRVNGELFSLKTYPELTPEMTKEMLFSILSDEKKEFLLTNRELDLGYNHGTARFRINLYSIRGAFAGAFRLITTKISPLESLNLPPILHNFTGIKQGFILVTGPTGEGKTTTIAAMINEINLKSSRHILTIEDPIEYIYPQARSIISQREIGQDTHSWSVALKSALREDPDVVLIGEMRDYETIQAALTIAETGHLVFSTLHTNSVPQTIDRIVDVFPSSQQNQVRMQLASTLKAVISQRLVPTIDQKSRIPACEILISSPAISSIIRENKTHLIDNVLETSSDQGMLLMEQYLTNLYMEGKISREVALYYAIRPQQIIKMIR